MKAGYLQLVEKGNEQRHLPRRRLRQRRDGQMYLDLPQQEVRTFFIVAMDEVHGTRLAQVISLARPSTVIDLRYAIRFDIPAMNRSLFFDCLSRNDAHYLRIPIAWHELKPSFVKTMAAIPHSLRHELIERKDGNLVLLVPKSEHARHISSELNLVLSSASEEDWDLEQAK
jgi:hypothetical protein